VRFVPTAADGPGFTGDGTTIHTFSFQETTRMKHKFLSLAAAAVLMPAVASAQGNLIYDNAFLATGGGIGTQYTIVTIGTQGQATSETGCARPDADPATTTVLQDCVIGGVTYADNVTFQGSSQLNVYQFSSIAGLTPENFRLVLNALENDEQIDISTMAVGFYSPNGTLLYYASISGQSLVAPDAGIGNYGFAYSLDAATKAFLNGTNLNNVYIGAAGSFTQVSSNHETIYFTAAGVTSTVPEPASMMLLGTGLLGLARVARRRFAKPAR
jgi:hypothetical protein